MDTKQSILSSLRSLVVVFCSILIVFVAARNTITWHCQQFWGASADFWQAQWDRILDVVGEDAYTLWYTGTMLVSFVTYWGLGGIYTVFDVLNKPSFIIKYKVQPGINEPVDRRKLLNTCLVVVINQVFSVPFVYAFYKAMEWRTYPPIRALPTFHWVLVELAVFLIIEEICFYYIHRLFHHKSIYKYAHKKHHEWTAPIAITAIYNHPIEHIICNIIPILLSVFIMGSHVATSYLWLVLAIFATLHTHSGYHLPFLPSPEFHDYHHLKFTQNYGVLGILDRLHGTDLQFRASPEYNRHVYTYNFVAPREMYPDNIKYKQGK
ncbi:hypothetical protein FQA39_LY18047 [Lamprigera yunnana]|nr:hypothetical protein FQA39_LY18047 [Lamprigera yunnana]